MVTEGVQVLNILKDYVLNRNLPKIILPPYNAHSVNSESKKTPQLTVSDFF